MSGSKSMLRKGGVVLVILCLVFTAFTITGCGSNANDNYVGTWSGSGEVTDDDGLTYNQTVSLSITSDGKWQMSRNIKGRVLGLTNSTINYSGTWEANKNKINLRIIQTTGNTADAGKYFYGEYVPNANSLIIGSDIGSLTKQS